LRKRKTVTIRLLYRFFRIGIFLICRPESAGAAPMVNRFPPEGGAGAPNPEFDGTGAPNGFDEPNPVEGNPALGVAGEAGCDPNKNGLPLPEPEAELANGEG
jgi:hypothetical protein